MPNAATHQAHIVVPVTVAIPKIARASVLIKTSVLPATTLVAVTPHALIQPAHTPVPVTMDIPRIAVASVSTRTNV
jgi:hypothetical protein